jgi:hypothetical protein
MPQVVNSLAMGAGAKIAQDRIQLPGTEPGVFARDPDLISREDAKSEKEEKRRVAMRRGAMCAASRIGR